MNWRLGFLRLWVVFSVLWLAGCAAWAVFHLPAGTDIRYPVTDPNGLKFVVTAPAGTAKSDIVTFMRNSAAVKSWQADCGKQRSGACGEEIPIQMPGLTSGPLPDIIPLLIFVLALPLVVLIFGLICAWVISGFQKPVIPRS